MDFISQFRTQLQSWWQNTPLPLDVDATFQSWHQFDAADNRWYPVDTAHHPIPNNTSPDDKEEPPDQPYNLVTWNVDYSSPFPTQRLSALLTQTLSLTPPPDIIFLQELSAQALQHLLTNPEIRRAFLLSDASGIPPPGQAFTTTTLLSRTRFPTPGPVWRVRYPSRFQRDALCCDIFVPGGGATTTTTPGARVRLVNVHLDSLPMQPSLRPAQVAVAAGLVRSAGRGVVAGDFNPVLAGDGGLVEENGLVDAWVEMHPGEDGFTWGVDGEEPFPPSRMDKVAVVGLRVERVEVLAPGWVSRAAAVRGVVVAARAGDVAAPGYGGGDAGDEMVPWSDHAGLRCSFRLDSGA
jgi:tyrosyl-DNA phosphodiesterase 2